LTRIRPFRSARTDARASRDVSTDARPAGGRPRRREPDPEAESRQRLRQGMWWVVLGVLFVGGLAAAILGDRGWRDVLRTRSEIAEMEQRLENQRQRVGGLRSEVERLQREPAAVERIAREELGYVKPGEVTFLLPKPAEEGEAIRPEPGPGHRPAPPGATP
jgi:cell division protein FtsB